MKIKASAADGHQMCSGGSVVGKASTIGIEISPTPPIMFTGRGQKVRQFELLAFENAARYPNGETKFLCRNDRPVLAKFCQVGSTHP